MTFVAVPFGDSDYSEVFGQASKVDVVFDKLLSSGGLPIWAKGDPLHLTPTAYGDVVVALLASSTAQAETHNPMPQESRSRMMSPGSRRLQSRPPLPAGSLVTVREPRVAAEGQTTGLVAAVAAEAGDACRQDGEAPVSTSGISTKLSEVSYHKGHSFFIKSSLSNSIFFFVTGLRKIKENPILLHTCMIVKKITKTFF